MNYSIIRYILARVFEFAGLFTLLPFFVGCIYGEPQRFAFLVVGIVCFVIGFVGKQWKPKSKVFYAKEGFVTVSLSWILLSLAGAVPFVLTGEIPSFIDAVFETVSGLTTTGGSVMPDVEIFSKCSQFWRLFTHWIGGMGVLVFILAVLPLSGSYNIHLMRAESPGPSVGKLVPKVKNTARILYKIYIVITVLGILALVLAGLPLYDAFTLTFSAVGTGGFGLLNSSVATYSKTVQTIILVLMFVCGINFSMFYLILMRKPKEVFQNEELRAYILIVLGATLLIGFNIRGEFTSMGEALFQACFHVVAVITTTGFSLLDFNLWPAFSKTILFLLTISGACAGSTGGGFKVSRLVILFKSIKQEIMAVVHPRSVKKLHMDGRGISDNVVHSIKMYLVIYMALYFISVLLISVDNFSMETNMTAVMSMINNVGPSFGGVGALGNYSEFSIFSKCVLMFDMLAGRLELLPVLVLFSPKTWKK